MMMKVTLVIINTIKKKKNLIELSKESNWIWKERSWSDPAAVLRDAAVLTTEKVENVDE